MVNIADLSRQKRQSVLKKMREDNKPGAGSTFREKLERHIASRRLARVKAKEASRKRKEQQNDAIDPER